MSHLNLLEQKMLDAGLYEPGTTTEFPDGSGSSEKPAWAVEELRCFIMHARSNIPDPDDVLVGYSGPVYKLRMSYVIEELLPVLDRFRSKLEGMDRATMESQKVARLITVLALFLCPWMRNHPEGGTIENPFLSPRPDDKTLAIRKRARAELAKVAAFCGLDRAIELWEGPRW